MPTPVEREARGRFRRGAATKKSCVSRAFIGAVALLIIGGWICVASATGQEAEPIQRRPNIVFLFTDDQAPWAVGSSGHPHAVTPHLDRLAGAGAYLTNSFTVTPVCSPSRAGLMTSRYGTELGITDWIHPQREPDLGLDPDTLTWPELFQQAGYATGLIGKWHLGVPDRFHPTRTGFDYFMGFRTGGTTPEDPVLEKDGVEREFDGLTPDILTDEAIGFIERHREQPFLLCLHFRAPHAAWLPVAEEDWAPFAELDPQIPNPLYPDLNIDRVKRMTREYLASTHSVDRNVGRLIAALDQFGLGDDTIVIFTSDHGYNMGHNGIWHKGNGHWVLNEPPPAAPNIPRGQRPNMYDHSIRVPTIVVWPGQVEPGSVVEDCVTNLDWYPSLLTMAGIPLPEIELRGRDLTPLLQGTETAWDQTVFGQYSTHHQSQTHMRMVRTPDWKLIRDFLNNGRDELYDLRDDPAESKNLMDSDLPEVELAIDVLDDLLLRHLRAIEDPVLPSIDPAPLP